jgi:hypothetical protein
VPKRRAARFVLEVVFLVAVAAALTVADQRAPVVAGVMLVGWVVAALFEWAAWLETPHFGRGLPPRYYVPEVALPPSHLIEQEADGYPAEIDAGEEADLTWIVPPSAWGEVLEDWPVLDSSSVSEETQIALPEPIGDDPFLDAVVEVPQPELTSELDLTGLAEPEAPVEEALPGDELEVAAEGEEEPVEPEPADETVVEEPVAAGPVAPLDEAVAAPEPAPEVAVMLPDIPAVRLTATHRIDPLALPQGGRFRRRHGHDDRAEVEVPAQPPAVRALPGRARRED